MILDLKTGAAESWHRLQTAAYEHLGPPINLTLDMATHCYSVNGVKIVGVTQVLYESGLVSEFAIQSELARDRGTAVHLACALLPDRLDWSSVDSRILPYVISYQQWMEKSKFLRTAAEHMGLNRELSYAGMKDMEGDLPVKVGASRGCLYLQGDGSLAKIQLHTDPNDWPMFVSFLNTWRWKHGAY